MSVQPFGPYIAPDYSGFFGDDDMRTIHINCKWLPSSDPKSACPLSASRILQEIPRQSHPLLLGTKSRIPTMEDFPDNPGL